MKAKDLMILRTLMMPGEMIDWLKAESDRIRLPQAEIIRRAVNQYRESAQPDEKQNSDVSCLRVRSRKDHR